MENELEHVAKAVEGVAESLVAEATTWAKQHPAYGTLVQALGTKALQALAAEVGITL